MSSIGKCCASEEIEEVIKRDGTQTLSFEASSTVDGSPERKQEEEQKVQQEEKIIVKDEEFYNNYQWSEEDRIAALTV